MTDITVQIGNSDNKLGQEAWSAFISEVESNIKLAGAEVHFTGFSSPAAPWQNAAWFFCLYSADRKEWLIRRMSEICKDYKQDSIAWTEGVTQFIQPCMAEEK